MVVVQKIQNGLMQLAMRANKQMTFNLQTIDYIGKLNQLFDEFLEKELLKQQQQQQQQLRENVKRLEKEESSDLATNVSSSLHDDAGENASEDLTFLQVLRYRLDLTDQVIKNVSEKVRRRKRPRPTAKPPPSQMEQEAEYMKELLNEFLHEEYNSKHKDEETLTGGDSVQTSTKTRATTSQSKKKPSIKDRFQDFLQRTGKADKFNSFKEDKESSESSESAPPTTDRMTLLVSKFLDSQEVQNEIQTEEKEERDDESTSTASSDDDDERIRQALAAEENNLATQRAAAETRLPLGGSKRGAQEGSASGITNTTALGNRSSSTSDDSGKTASGARHKSSTRQRPEEDNISTDSSTNEPEDRRESLLSSFKRTLSDASIPRVVDGPLPSPTPQAGELQVMGSDENWRWYALLLIPLLLVIIMVGWTRRRRTRSLKEDDELTTKSKSDTPTDNASTEYSPSSPACSSVESNDTAVPDGLALVHGETPIGLVKQKVSTKEQPRSSDLSDTELRSDDGEDVVVESKSLAATLTKDGIDDTSHHDSESSSVAPPVEHQVDDKRDPSDDSCAIEDQALKATSLEEEREPRDDEESKASTSESHALADQSHLQNDDDRPEEAGASRDKAAASEIQHDDSPSGIGLIDEATPEAIIPVGEIDMRDDDELKASIVASDAPQNLDTIDIPLDDQSCESEARLADGTLTKSDPQLDNERRTAKSAQKLEPKVSNALLSELNHYEDMSEIRLDDKKDVKVDEVLVQEMKHYQALTEIQLDMIGNALHSELKRYEDQPEIELDDKSDTKRDDDITSMESASVSGENTALSETTQSDDMSNTRYSAEDDSLVAVCEDNGRDDELEQDDNSELDSKMEQEEEEEASNVDAEEHTDLPEEKNLDSETNKIDFDNTLRSPEAKRRDSLLKFGMSFSRLLLEAEDHMAALEDEVDPELEYELSSPTPYRPSENSMRLNVNLEELLAEGKAEEFDCDLEASNRSNLNFDKSNRESSIRTPTRKKPTVPRSGVSLRKFLMTSEENTSRLDVEEEGSLESSEWKILRSPTPPRSVRSATPPRVQSSNRLCDLAVLHEESEDDDLSPSKAAHTSTPSTPQTNQADEEEENSNLQATRRDSLMKFGMSFKRLLAEAEDEMARVEDEEDPELEYEVSERPYRPSENSMLLNVNMEELLAEGKTEEFDLDSSNRSALNFSQANVGLSILTPTRTPSQRRPTMSRFGESVQKLLLETEESLLDIEDDSSQGESDRSIGRATPRVQSSNRLAELDVLHEESEHDLSPNKSDSAPSSQRLDESDNTQANSVAQEPEDRRRESLLKFGMSFSRLLAEAEDEMAGVEDEVDPEDAYEVSAAPYRPSEQSMRLSVNMEELLAEGKAEELDSDLDSSNRSALQFSKVDADSSIQTPTRRRSSFSRFGASVQRLILETEENISHLNIDGEESAKDGDAATVSSQKRVASSSRLCDLEVLHEETEHDLSPVKKEASPTHLEKAELSETRHDALVEETQTSSSSDKPSLGYDKEVQASGLRRSKFASSAASRKRSLELLARSFSSRSVSSSNKPTLVSSSSVDVPASESTPALPRATRRSSRARMRILEDFAKSFSSRNVSGDGGNLATETISSGESSPAVEPSMATENED